MSEFLQYEVKQRRRAFWFLARTLLRLGRWVPFLILAGFWIRSFIASDLVVLHNGDQSICLAYSRGSLLIVGAGFDRAWKFFVPTDEYSNTYEPWPFEALWHRRHWPWDAAGMFEYNYAEDHVELKYFFPVACAIAGTVPIFWQWRRSRAGKRRSG
jgi:hypothetical protein